MRTFKSTTRQPATPPVSSKKLQVTTDFQSDTAQPQRHGLDQTHMKRQLLALADEYERLFRDRVYLAFESEGQLPGPSSVQREEEDPETAERVRKRQERYEDDRAIQVDVQQFSETPSQYTSIRASPAPRTHKPSYPSSHVSTPYKDSGNAVAFLKSSTDTLAQALSSLSGFTSNMEGLMSNLTKATSALHSSIRSYEASQQSTHRPYEA